MKRTPSRSIDVRVVSLQGRSIKTAGGITRGTQIASVCVGSFLLAEAGLLQDRQATTAWIMARELAARYPQAKVNPHAVLLEDGAIVTSGAITATFDLALLPKPRSSQAPTQTRSSSSPGQPTCSPASQAASRNG